MHGPLLIESEETVLLQADHPDSAHVAEMLGQFAELEKQPGDLHNYRLTPLSIWQGVAAGLRVEQMLELLQEHARGKLPYRLTARLVELASRYGRLSLVTQGEKLLLMCSCPDTCTLVASDSQVRGLLLQPAETTEAVGWIVAPEARGELKQLLTRMGYPVLDQAGYRSGERLDVRLRKATGDTDGWQLRDYQQEAVARFLGGSYGEDGGSGVLVLPCGAGKTVIGTAVIAALGCAVLIVTSSAAAVRQWQRELLERTTLQPIEVGLYAGEDRRVAPVTITTYHLLTHRSRGQQGFAHMRLFGERDWGLIVYDEVHLLPAPVFRMTADLQATRRLGLTATLVREDGREADVFSLIGPKRLEVKWKTMEHAGWIASVQCVEIRVSLTETDRACYERAGARARLRLASENSRKLDTVQELLLRHSAEQVLIIGHYIGQLSRIAEACKAPLLTGQTPLLDREALYAAFRSGVIRVLVLSRVANLAINLPDAAVAIQVSGSFGSRQEEAQRIGRIVRPKSGSNRAYFYTLVSDHTKEMVFARKRQLFMVEQGYGYEVLRAEGEASRAKC